MTCEHRECGPLQAGLAIGPGADWTKYANADTSSRRLHQQTHALRRTVSPPYSLGVLNGFIARGGAVGALR
jgi:hypothetical protein